MIDDRDLVTDDPAPCIMLTDKDLNEIYRIPASDHLSYEIASKFMSDQSYMGSVWAYAGQYEYKLHGVNNEGPQMKLIEHSDGSVYLICGFESVKRVEPSAGTSGDTRAKTSIYQLFSDHYSGVTSGTSSIGWTYPDVVSETAHASGPDLIRNTAIGVDRIIACLGDYDTNAAVIVQTV
jgi:hypothetical protein